MSFDKKQSHSSEENVLSSSPTDAFEIDSPTSASLSSAPTQPNTSLKPNSVLNLQRMIGNRAVMRLISGKLPALPKFGRSRSSSPAVQRSGNAGGVIQRVNLENVGLLKKKLELTDITHTDLAKIKYPSLSLAELKELDAEVTRLLKIYDSKESEENLALFKANKSIQFFISKRGKEEQIEKISSNKEMFLVDGSEIHIKLLANELKVDVDVLLNLPTNVYEKVGNLLEAIEEKTGKKPVGFPHFLKGSDLEDYFATFKKEYNDEFFHMLKDFRQNDNIFPNPKFRGGEGQIFLSDVNVGKCLKRWFEKRLGQFDESVGLLEQSLVKVQEDKVLSKLVSVVNIYAKGSDWIIRDFDLTSNTLEKFAESNTDTQLAIQQVKEYQSQVTEEPLKGLVDKIVRLSDNIHWSPSLGKILVIDMM